MSFEEQPTQQHNVAQERQEATDQVRSLSQRRERLLSDVRNISFPTAIRGYDRQAVDAYVVQVNDLIAELDATRSPDAAVKRALESIGEQTGGILQRAQETAQEIIDRSEADAEGRRQEAEGQARQIREQAHTRVRELENEAEAMRRRRGELIEDVRRLSEKLAQLADSASQRVKQEESLSEELSGQHPVAGSSSADQTDSTGTGVDEQTTRLPRVGGDERQTGPSGAPGSES